MNELKARDMDENEEIPGFEEDQLPNGWRWISLGDVAEICPSRVPDGATHVLSIADAELWLSQAGSVIIVVRSELLGRNVVIPTSVSHEIDPEYLAYWLTGTGPDAIRPHSMRECRLPLPLMPEQQRILAEIRKGVGDLQESIDDANACLSLYIADSVETDSERESLRQRWVRNRS